MLEVEETAASAVAGWAMATQVAEAEGVENMAVQLAVSAEGWAGWAGQAVVLED